MARASGISGTVGPRSYNVFSLYRRLFRTFTGVYNVKDFKANGNGTVLARAQIQEAIYDAQAAGASIVYLPKGVYLLDPTVHPHTNSRIVFLVLPGGMTLRGAGKGATILKLQTGFTRPAAATGGALAHTIINLNSEGADPIDVAPIITDLSIDGQAATQTILTNGIFYARARGGHVTRVRVQDCYGNATGPPGETFHIETETGADTYYTDCEVFGTTLNTASGFSANGAFGVHYTNCVGRNMGITHGFTHYESSMVTHTNCHAYNNAASGFNSDSSEAIQYLGCVAGGRMSATTLNALFGAAAQEGNHDGFTVGSTSAVATGIDYVGCSSRYNANIGLFVQDATDGVHVVGGAYLNNGVYDIGANALATRLNISPSTRFVTSSAAGTLPAGMFDVKTGSGDQKVDSHVVLDGDLTVNKDILWQRNNSLRWIMRMAASTEPGSNAGSDLTLQPRDDAGAGLTTALTFLRRTSLVQAGKGFVQALKAGAPVDGDYATTPPDGTMITDTTNSKLYVRIGGTWKSVTLT